MKTKYGMTFQQIKKGIWIEHKVFGIGKVMTAKHSYDWLGPYVSINFKRFGIKCLTLPFAISKMRKHQP